MMVKLLIIAFAYALVLSSARAICPYDVNCLNNPYGGRLSSPSDSVASPYGRGQLGAAFEDNPFRGDLTTNPYAPRTEPEGQENGRAKARSETESLRNRLGDGAVEPGQGIDPDQGN